MRMTEDHRAGADQKIDIIASVLVPDTPALAARDDDIGREIAEAAGWQHTLRTFQPMRLRVRLIVGHGTFLSKGPVRTRTKDRLRKNEAQSPARLYSLRLGESASCQQSSDRNSSRLLPVFDLVLCLRVEVRSRMALVQLVLGRAGEAVHLAPALDGRAIGDLVMPAHDIGVASGIEESRRVIIDRPR